MRRIFAALAALCFSVGSADAAVTWDFEETASGVFGTLSGSLDLTGATSYRTGPYSKALTPNYAVLSTGGDLSIFSGATGPKSFGTSNSKSPTVSGSLFYLYGAQGQYGVSNSYVSGSALSGTMNFAGATLASLGLSEGSFVWTVPGDTITLNFRTATPVPLPASLPLLLAALGTGALLRRRRG